MIFQIGSALLCLAFGLFIACIVVLRVADKGGAGAPLPEPFDKGLLLVASLSFFGGLIGFVLMMLSVLIHIGRALP